MAKRYLLDTSALLAHHRREAGAEVVQAIMEEEGASVFLASVSLAEFARRLHEFGASEAEIAHDLAAYEELADAVLPVNAAVARAAYTLGRATPERLPLIDALIAATAQRAEAVLVHRDQHLRGVPGKLLRQRELARREGGE